MAYLEEAEHAYNGHGALHVMVSQWRTTCNGVSMAYLEEAEHAYNGHGASGGACEIHQK